jgi:hypothetical protein
MKTYWLLILAYLSCKRNLPDSMLQITWPVQWKRRMFLVRTLFTCDRTSISVNKPTGQQIISKTHPNHRRWWKLSLLLCTYPLHFHKMLTNTWWSSFFGKRAKSETHNFKVRSSVQGVWGMSKERFRLSTDFIQILLSKNLVYFKTVMTLSVLIYSQFYEHLFQCATLIWHFNTCNMAN